MRETNELVQLLEQELSKREELLKSASKLVNNALEGHIVNDSVDIDNMTKEELENLKLAELQSMYSKIKHQILVEYVRQNSGMDFESVFIEPTEIMINKAKEQYNISNSLVDAINIKDNSDIVNMFNQSVKLPEYIQTLEPEMQKKYMFELYSSEIIKMGFSPEQLAQACEVVAIQQMGAKRKEGQSYHA